MCFLPLLKALLRLRFAINVTGMINTELFQAYFFAIMVALMAFSESIERLTGAFVSRMVFGKSNLKRHRKNSNIFDFSSQVNIDFV